ncbi:MAG TPA: glycosyltransferase family 4 protein [Casimicrobiaceae bacterium]|nr:glycosyltransferase family 4 protein [Casimicrobiaceae bacterium]
MRIAFYAPLKSPDHPVPSGDRQIARYLLRALHMYGHEVTIASRLRSFDRTGNAERQQRIGEVGQRVAERLVARLRRLGNAPDLWFTYHVHHKAPDLIGPVVANALGIPYVVAEASIAPKQRDGRWSIGYAQSLAAIRAADGVVALNPVDVAEVRSVRGDEAMSLLLPPFVDVAALAGLAQMTRSKEPRAVPQLITVAMMREGDKLASYRFLAKALQRVTALPWRLVVVGDGPARHEVEAAFAAFDRDRLRFVGERGPAEIVTLLSRSDLFVWPAIGEALGIALLEAQACQVPVIAGDCGGVSSVVAQDRSGQLVPPHDAETFAVATTRLLLDYRLRERLSLDALAYVKERHDLPVAATFLDCFLREIVRQRAR